MPLSIRATELEDFTPTKIFNLIQPIAEIGSYIPSQRFKSAAVYGTTVFNTLVGG